MFLLSKNRLDLFVNITVLFHSCELFSRLKTSRVRSSYSIVNIYKIKVNVFLRLFNNQCLSNSPFVFVEYISLLSYNFVVIIRFVFGVNKE